MSCQHLQHRNLKTHKGPATEQIPGKCERVAGIDGARRFGACRKRRCPQVPPAGRLPREATPESIAARVDGIQLSSCISACALRGAGRGFSVVTVQAGARTVNQRAAKTPRTAAAKLLPRTASKPLRTGGGSRSSRRYGVPSFE